MFEKYGDLYDKREKKKRKIPYLKFIAIIIVISLILFALWNYWANLTFNSKEDFDDFEDLELVITTNKEVYARGEEIKIKVSIKNNGNSLAVLHYYGLEVYAINTFIKNQDGKPVWNSGFSGLPPPAYHYNLTIDDNSAYFVKLKWDQVEHLKGGCVIEPPGDQVPAGEYTIHANTYTDLNRNMTLSSSKTIFIKMLPF